MKIQENKRITLAYFRRASSKRTYVLIGWCRHAPTTTRWFTRIEIYMLWWTLVIDRFEKHPFNLEIKDTQ